MKKSVKLYLVMMMLSVDISNAFCQEMRPEVIGNAKKSIVVVNNTLSRQAYGITDCYTKGIGCIVDKSNGIILTTRGIVGHAAIGTYTITFHNGEQADAKLCYYDPWLDYAFLKVLPEEIPVDTTVIMFSDTVPAINQPVFMIDNNEGKGFSIHMGNVSSMQEICGSMPQHTTNVSFDTKNNAIGTPILDGKGQAVGLYCRGSETFGIGLHPAYIQYALSFIRQGKIPVRKHIGVIASTYALNDGVKYRRFPKEEVKAYVKRFPTSLSNAIQVVRVVQGTPAYGQLFAGDILWAIDGQAIGPNLVTLDMAMNHTSAPQVCLTVFRNGAWQDVNIPLYDLEDHKIKRMVSFGGALFFESDDIFSDKVGIPPGKLAFSNAQASTTFATIPHETQGDSMHFLLELPHIADVAICNLEQLIRYVPKLVEQRYFTVNYTQLFPYSDSLSELFGRRLFQRYVCQADIAYDINSPEPRLFTFDSVKMTWSSEPIQ